MNHPLKDYRTICLLLGVLAMLVLFIHPARQQKTPTYNYTFIIDITRSMNVSDYRQDGQTVSRLEFVKHSLRELLKQLPCQSKVGLGLFTERRSTLLFEPLEVCSAYTEIDTAISKIDWRMAWAADSNIAKGLLSTLEMLQKSGSSLIFMTDGQEAPPVNPKYRADFAAIKEHAKGMLIGVGGLEAAPIPKFDGQGRQIGFYAPDDVPQRSSFGESNLDPSQIKGYNARNAPFGSAAAIGNEHLSALQETYLEKLGAESGLSYARLTNWQSLLAALRNPKLATEKMLSTDSRREPALSALLLLSLVYMPSLFRYRRFFRR